ncbi:MAG: NAD(P)/FAD-dependent oxidoreductase, partial [Gemmatimonadota bacterium]
PALISDLNLASHGLEVVAADPAVFAPQPDGRHLLLWTDPAAAAESIRGFSNQDAGRWPEFSGLLGRLAGFLAALHAAEPPDVPRPGRQDAGALFGLARAVRGLGRQDIAELLRILPMSSYELMDEWFESDALRGALSTAAVRGGIHGPMAAGTAHGLLREVIGSPPGAVLSTLRARGGIGQLSEALASAARAAGAQIHTNSPVRHVLTGKGRARGIVLGSGEEIEADLVLSSLGPGVTLSRLVDPANLDPEFLRKLRSVRYRGATAKVHLALGEIPQFTCLPGDGPHMRGAISICPSLEYLERASDAAKYGHISEQPYLEAVIPSLTDPAMAPPGKHSMSVLVQYAPYHLQEGKWDAGQRDRLGDLAIETLAQYAPNLRGAVEDRQVLSPADMESRWGLQEGNIHQGEMTLDQFFFTRPIAGWARYRTPIEGLYLCGAGTHPGGGVTGYSGYNSARRVLRDTSRRSGQGGGS